MKWYAKNLIIMLVVVIIAGVFLSPPFYQPTNNPGIIPPTSISAWPGPILSALAVVFALAGLLILVRMFLALGAKRIGNVLIAVGFLFVLGCGAIFIQANSQENDAERNAENTMQAFFEQVDVIAPSSAFPSDINGGNTPPGSGAVEGDDRAAEDVNGEDSTAEDSQDELKFILLDGEAYIGVLTIPELNLDLPVAMSWSYPQLRQTPCRYSGSINNNSLVIAAHSYRSHFGDIDRLSIGEPVILTDVEGYEHIYEVVKVEIVEPTSVDAVVNSEYDLTMFTCTRDSKSRILVRCMRTEQ